MEYFSATKRKEVWLMLQHDEPWKRHAKWKEPDAKGHMSRFHFYEMSKQVNLQRQSWEEWGVTANEYEVSPGNNKDALTLMAAQLWIPQTFGLCTLSECCRWHVLYLNKAVFKRNIYCIILLIITFKNWQNKSMVLEVRGVVTFWGEGQKRELLDAADVPFLDQVDVLSL